MWKEASNMLDWKSIGSILATFMFLRTALREFLPPEVYRFLHQAISHLIAAIHPRVTIIIDEFDSSASNELFDSVETYLSSKCFSSATVLKLSKPNNSRALTFTMDTTQRLDDDSYPSIPVRWSFNSIENKSSRFFTRERRYYELSFHRRLKSAINSHYLPYVMEEAANIRFRNRERRLYTNRSAEDSGRHWSSVPFVHPASFETLAIDPTLRDTIKADLDKFVRRKEYYIRVGRPWKRGYLLYGPPGTGKTSLIAAIANYLEFDIYDLELSAVTSNSQLRKLLIATSSKSVIVVEDVDCTLDLSNRKKKPIKPEDEDESSKEEDELESGRRGRRRRRENALSGSYSTVSLSGVLNFVDGLWSTCVGERLMVFTTNHVEKLDPALLRPGRMDKHVHLSYCEMAAFKVLARNYLYTEEGDYVELMDEAEKLLTEAKMTPADIAEVFMSCNDDAAAGMKMVVEEMKRRIATSSAEQSTDQSQEEGVIVAI